MQDFLQDPARRSVTATALSMAVEPGKWTISGRRCESTSKTSTPWSLLWNV